MKFLFHCSKFVRIYVLLTPIQLVLGAESESSLQFFDSSGTQKTVQFGWQGSSNTGHFFIKSNNSQKGLSLKNGNLFLDGSLSTSSSLTAQTFIGDGSQLVNLPKPTLSWSDISDKPPLFTPSAHFHTKNQVSDLPANIVESVSATTGLSLSGTASHPSLAVNFAGSGSANTVAKSDHSHSNYLTQDGLSTLNAPKSLSYKTSSPTATGATLSLWGTNDLGLYVGAYGNTNASAYFRKFEGNKSDVTLNGLYAGIRVVMDTGWSGFFTSGGERPAGAFLARDGMAGLFGGDVEVTGTLHYYNLNNKSDSSLKTDVKPLNDILQKIRRLQAVSYTWKKDSVEASKKQRQYGLLAQEVRKIFPELVKPDHEGYLTVSYIQLVPLLIEALKEQQVNLEKQEARVLELEKRIKKIEERYP